MYGKLSKTLAIAALACAVAACNAPDTIMENGAITLYGNKVALRVIGSPKAVIDADGSLVIDGKPIPITPAERSLLAQYNQSVRSVHDTGLAMGKAGIETATKAGAAENSFAPDKADKLAEAGAGRIQDLSLGICKAQAAIKAEQDQLATQLAAFKPYAAIVSAADVADCANDAKN
jgi:hypothetical protein